MTFRALVRGRLAPLARCRAPTRCGRFQWPHAGAISAAPASSICFSFLSFFRFFSPTPTPSTSTTGSQSSSQSGGNMVVKDFVEEQIANNKVVVFSKTWCPYCRKAKNLLNTKNVEVTVVELDERDDGDAIQNYLQEKTGQRSVPNIFIGTKHIGGCDDIHGLEKVGGLNKLLTN